MVEHSRQGDASSGVVQPGVYGTSHHSPEVEGPERERAHPQTCLVGACDEEQGQVPRRPEDTHHQAGEDHRHAPLEPLLGVAAPARLLKAANDQANEQEEPRTALDQPVLPEGGGIQQHGQHGERDRQPQDPEIPAPGEHAGVKGALEEVEHVAIQRRIPTADGNQKAGHDAGTQGAEQRQDHGRELKHGLAGERHDAVERPGPGDDAEQVEPRGRPAPYCFRFWVHCISPCCCRDEEASALCTSPDGTRFASMSVEANISHSTCTWSSTQASRRSSTTWSR